MLNFDSNHTAIEGNLNQKKGKHSLKNMVVAGLLITNVLTFSGCAKTIDCDIEGTHAHYYVNEEDLGRYIISEKSSVSGLDRLDNYVYIDQENIELLEFVNKNDLFRIEDNKEYISNITETQEDYKEYRYSYYYLIPIPVIHSTGKTTFTTYYYIPKAVHSWTSNPDKNNLTGEERICHYVYYGYKIIQKDGNYELEKSNPVDNLNELPEGYDYIKEKFYEVVDLNNKNEKLDYEDGPEEDKEIISEEEYNKSKSKTR